MWFNETLSFCDHIKTTTEKTHGDRLEQFKAKSRRTKKKCLALTAEHHQARRFFYKELQFSQKPSTYHIKGLSWKRSSGSLALRCFSVCCIVPWRLLLKFSRCLLTFIHQSLSRRSFAVSYNPWITFDPEHTQYSTRRLVSNPTLFNITFASIVKEIRRPIKSVMFDNDLVNFITCNFVIEGQKQLKETFEV